MYCEITLPCLCAMLLLSLSAEAQLIINNCDDAAGWRGGTTETELVKEGTGAIRWVPSEHRELSTRQIPPDWSAGNCLKFWMHSAKATGSPIWLIIPSEDETKQGMDYFALRFRTDWEGWREIVVPFDEIGRTRHPIGWHKIDRFMLHAAWNPELTPNPEDSFVIDDIRVVSLSITGPRMTDEEFFEAMDLDRPGLQQVKGAVEAGDLEKAKAEFHQYFLARRDAKWFTNWWERPEVPAKRPGTGRADETLQHIYYFDRGRYELGPDIDWTSNQRDEGEAATIEWNAALNRFPFLRYLSGAHWGTLEDKYAAEIVAMMLDWIEDAPLLLLSSGNSPYHWAWETLNTACRGGDSWINAIWRTADAPAWTPDALCTVLKSLAEHARHLMKWPSRGNWLTAESKAITIVGMLLPELKESQAWRETGIERLYNQMEKEIYPDGLENELALGYNNWVLRNYANILDLAVLNGRRDEIPADYQDRLERMYAYQLYAMAPDWRVPGLNDSGYANPQSYLQKGFEYFPERTDFQWGATRGKEGQRPEKTSCAFEYSGHYVMRTGWDPDARFLFLDAGPFGSGHQHEDKLTFTMRAHGHEWIVEGGSYMYDHSRWRRYVLSTRGHNTARVDGQDQNRRRARDTWVLPYPFEPLGNPWLTSDDFDYVSGVYESGYGPQREIKVRHQRQVLFIKPDYWIIVDTFDPEDDAAHEYETIFHINAEQADIEGTRVFAEADGKRFDIVAVGEGASVEVVKGIEEEPVQGWANYPWRPVPTALFRNEAAGRVRNAYVMYPGENAEAASPAVEAINTAREDQPIALRIQLPRGETHYFTKLGPDLAGRGPVTVGPITTDADVCLVKVSAEGKVASVFALGGTRVEYEGAEVREASPARPEATITPLRG